MTDPLLANKILNVFLEKGELIYRYSQLAKDLGIDRYDTIGVIREIRLVYPQWIVIHTHKDKPTESFQPNLTYKAAMRKFLAEGGFVNMEKQNKNKGRRDARESFWKRTPWLVSIITALVSSILTGVFIFLFQQWYNNKQNHPVPQIIQPLPGNIQSNQVNKLSDSERISH